MRPKSKIERTRNLTTEKERSLRRSTRIRHKASKQTGTLTRSATAAKVTKKEEHVAKTKCSTRKIKKKLHGLKSNVEAPAKLLTKHSDRQTRKSTKEGIEKRQQRSRTQRLITKSNTKVGLIETMHKKRRAETTRKTMAKKRRIGQTAIRQPLDTDTENVQTWQHRITFGTEIHYYGSNDVTRYCDVAFLDDNHVLAVDDSYIHAKEGYRVCCFRLDGTLVADLLLPGYPWTIVALSDSEAVVSLRRTKSRGLMWLSIDIERRIIIPINNPEFENYLGQMYPAELEIKDTTESTTSASYLDLLLSIGRDGQLHTSIYDKRDDFNFHITNFPFLSSNIPSSPAYGVFISQLIRYARDCSSYECFILRARRLSSKLLKQGYLVERLKSSFRKFYGRYGDLVEQYGVTLSRMLNDILTPDQQ